MSLRSLLLRMSPWRYGWTCVHCGRVEPCRWVEGDGRDLGVALTKAMGCCDNPVPLVQRALAPWVRLRYAVPLIVLAWALLAFASRAEASTWSRTIEWRSSVVRLVSACGSLDESVVLAELETGRARAIADLGRDDLPPLGTATDPYVILALAEPRCPGNALACSSRAPLSRSTWTLVRTTCGPDVLAALDHELFHFWAYRLTGSLELGMRADHPAGEGFRYDLLGRRVAIRPQVPKPAPPVEPVPPEPEPKLTKRQAEILARLPAGWFSPVEVGADDAVCRRLARKGALQSDGKGRYRRKS